jgi:N-acetylglutamate synthase-like GNAT family acetyltransferase
MNDRPLTRHRDEFLLTTDRTRIDVDAALTLLQTTHWAAKMQRTELELAIDNSISFGVLRDSGELVAFARVVTDLATYAYLTDVVVEEQERGRGLSRWIIEEILAHPQLQGLRRFTLLTTNAQDLYAKYGFTSELGKLVYMELRGSR